MIGRDRMTRSTALIAAITVLSLANEFGRYSSATPVRVAAVVLVLSSAALACVATRSRSGPAPRSVWSVAIAACVGSMSGAPLDARLAVVALASGAAVPYAATRFAKLLIAVVATLVIGSFAANFTVGYAPNDVFTMLQGAAGTLLHGADPYGPGFPIVDFSTTPVSLTPRRMGYGPSILLLSTPGRLLGDVRFAGLAMWIITVSAIAGLIRRHGRRRDVRRMLALLLGLPMVPTMIYLAWADVYAMAMLSGWLALRGRHRTAAIICLGLCLAAKPTLGAVLLVTVVWSRAMRKDLPGGVAVAAAIVVPFAVWDGSTFWQSTVGVAFQPALFISRSDGVGISAVAHVLTGRWVAGSILVLLTLAMSLPVLAIRPRDGADVLALGGALTTLIVVTNRLAFLNYYFVAVVALLLALALEAGGDAFDDIALPAIVRRVIVRTDRIPAIRFLSLRPAISGRVRCRVTAAHQANAVASRRAGRVHAR